LAATRQSREKKKRFGKDDERDKKTTTKRGPKGKMKRSGEGKRSIWGIGKRAVRDGGTLGAVKTKEG